MLNVVSIGDQIIVMHITIYMLLIKKVVRTEINDPTVQFSDDVSFAN